MDGRVSFSRRKCYLCSQTDNKVRYFLELSYSGKAYCGWQVQPGDPSVQQAVQQALSGKEWDGFKLVEGRSNRKYSNEAAVIEAVEKAGFDPYEKKLLGITAMQKLLGKSRFDELLTAYIVKPQGKPTLVPESDKRPAMNTAKNDFMEENDNE